MKHEDGIEVYVKPRREGGDDLRFPELIIPDHDPSRRRCCIPVIDGQCKIVLRFSHDFDMFAADSIRIGHTLMGSPAKGKMTIHHVSQPSISGQQLEFTNRVDLLRRLQPIVVRAQQGQLQRSPGRGPGAHSAWIIASGTLLVYITRGTYRPREEQNSLRSLVGRPFEKLHGNNGKDYVFEFHFRSQASIVEDEKSLKVSGKMLAPAPHLNAATGFKFVPDLEYSVAKAETERIREEVQARSFKPQRASTSCGSNIHKISTRKPPKICTCPASSHARPQPKTGASVIQSSRQSSNDRVQAQESDEANASHLESSSAAPDFERAAATGQDPVNDTAAEFSAKSCNHCKNLKKAPRGKKIAWRQRAGKWMYVHKDAPDEEGPAEPKNYDEALLGARNEAEQVPGETLNVVDAAKTDKQLHQPDDDGAFVTDTHGNGTVAKEPNEHGEGGNPAPESGEEAISTTQENVDAGSKERPEEGDKFIVASNQKNAMLVESTAASEATLAETNETSTPPQRSIVRDVDVIPKKRQDSSEHETPVSKRARVDIDLTLDDDDDPVVVKSEYGDTTKRYGPTLEDKKRRLEHVKRERRILAMRLEDERKAAEEAELERDIARSEGRGRSTGRIEDAAIIKTEV